MNSSQILRTIVMILVLLLLALGAVCGYQYMAAASAAQAIVAEQEALATAKQQVVEAARAQKEAGKLVKQIVKRPPSWSWSEQLPLMVDALSGVIKGSGVTVEAMQPAPMVERKQVPVTRFPLRLTMHATLDSLTKFLKLAQQAEPVLAVDELAIRTGQKPGDPLEVDITLSSFVIIDGQRASGEKR